MLTAEYRWRPSRYIDMAIFYDTGQVVRDYHDFNGSQFDSAWGLGARFHGPNFNALRIEVALPWLLAKAANRLLPILRKQTTLLLEKK